MTSGGGVCDPLRGTEGAREGTVAAQLTLSQEAITSLS